MMAYMKCGFTFSEYYYTGKSIYLSKSIEIPIAPVLRSSHCTDIYIEKTTWLNTELLFFFSLFIPPTNEATERKAPPWGNALPHGKPNIHQHIL